MLTTSPLLTSDSKNASPRSLQFASRSPLPGSPTRSRSRCSKNSIASQSPTVAPASAAGRPTSALMASPSNPPRAQNSAQESSKPANGFSPADPAKQIVVPVEPSPESANMPAAQEPPRQPQSAQAKPNSAKRSANPSDQPAPPGADPQSAAASNAAGEEPARPAQRAKTLPAAPKTLPLAYETCSIEDIVVLIAHMLTELIETNDGLALSSGNLTRFHSR